MHYTLDHLAFKVSSLTEAVRRLQHKGAICEHTGFFPEVGMHIGFIRYNNHLVELLEPADAACPIWNDPVGLHHIGLAVPNVYLWHKQLSEEIHYFKPEPLRKGRHGDIFFFRLVEHPQWLFECL